MLFTIRETQMRSQNKVTNNQNPHSASNAPQLVEPADSRINVLITGLEILEYMGRCTAPVTPDALAEALNISSASVGRSLSVLEQRGYLTKSGSRAAY